jgi:exosome complex component RRP40
MNSGTEEMAGQAGALLQGAENSVDVNFHSINVSPGDDVTEIVTQSRKGIKLGKGLEYSNERIIANTAGKLKYRAPTSYWVESMSMHFVPRVGDHVVGMIEDKGGEFYRVNIFGGTSAILNRLSFEGATKRNKPELQRGEVIYAKVVTAHKDFDIELTCISSTGTKKEWSSGESIYGGLANGLFVRVSLYLAKQMLLPDCVLLNALGKHYAFEVAVGMNGGIWLRTNRPLEAIIIRNAILNVDRLVLNDFQVDALVEKLVEMGNASGKGKS